MAEIEFVKMHGVGNDYIFIDTIHQPVRANFNRLARLVSDRHTGVGGDGLITLRRGRSHPFRMEIYNTDGSQAEMCGNGVRCLARLIYEAGHSTSRSQAIETRGGIIRTEITSTGNGQKPFTVRVDMGRPELETRRIPVRAARKYFINQSVRMGSQKITLTCLALGNPHAVTFVCALPENWALLAQKIAALRLFPKGVNVSFASVQGRRKMTLRVWERGAGATQACGTGACAAAVAAVLNGLAERTVSVHLPGGSLNVAWDQKTDHVFLTGPAVRVFSGRFEF
jgi:diaminopimelate epimerase